MDLRSQDQAASLRSLTRREVRATSATKPRPAAWAEGPRVIAIASGKGGVGKTSLTANLAVAFAKQGARVLAVDADLGLANLDLALGVSPKYSMADLVDGAVGIDQVVTTGPHDVCVLPASSGRYDLANLSERQRLGLFTAIDQLEDRFDVLLVDSPAGIGANAVSFAAAAQQVVIVANNEPTSLADAYAFVKVMATKCGVKHVHLVANMVKSAAEGEEVFRRFSVLVERFLGISVEYLGPVLRDAGIQRAVCAGVPVLIGEPRTAGAQCITAVAKRLAESSQGETSAGGIRLFWKRLLGWRMPQ